MVVNAIAKNLQKINVEPLLLDSEEKLNKYLGVTFSLPVRGLPRELSNTREKRTPGQRKNEKKTKIGRQTKKQTDYNGWQKSKKREQLQKDANLTQRF